MQKIYKLFSSSILALLLLVIYAIAMAMATFIENDYGTAVAWASVYDSWWFEFLQLGLVISFIANIFKYRLYRKEKWAVLLFHLAFIILLLGAGITRYSSYSGIMRIREGETSNVVISDTKLLSVTLIKGEEHTQIRKKLNFSPLKENDFTINKIFQELPITISFKEYVTDASPEVILDSIKGVPLLKMVTTGGHERNTIYLKKGEVEKIGSHEHEIGFESDKEGIINIYEKNGLFQIRSPFPVDFFMMENQQAGRIKQDSLQKMSLRTLYRSGDFSFVPTSFHPRGKFKLISTSSKKIENDKSLDDALIITVKVGDEEQEVNILYREGFLPIKHQVDFKNGVKAIISYGAGAIKIPFSIKLNNFELERYPGSSSPSAYTSNLTVVDDNIKFDYRIFMNNVLDYKGFRFFQASYDTDEKGTVLSVNHDFLGTWITYLGYLLMGIGMFFTLFGKASQFQLIQRKLKKVKLKGTISTFVLIFTSLSLLAVNKKDGVPMTSIDSLIRLQQTQLDEEQARFFARLLVQDLDGRIKPINTLASECIRKLSKKSSFKYLISGNTIQLNVSQVFLGMHMAPHIWQRIPIIKVDTGKTKYLLNTIPKGSNGLYSFISFLDKDGNYLLASDVEKANKKKPSERNEFDKEVLKIDERFNILYNLFAGTYLRIFPNKKDEHYTWFSYRHHFNDFTEEDARFAKNILPAYFKDIQERKYEAAYEKLMYIKKYQEILGKEIIPSSKQIEAELWYQNANLNFWLFQILFMTGFMLLIVAVVKMFSNKKKVSFVWNMLIVITLISFLLFTFNLLLRWYIAQHAPWSNGYEMLVFVAWCLLLSGLLSFRKSDFVLPLATLFAGALLFVSYLDWLSPEITNLMPVLKSYWLKIHVATIVSSYAPLALSAVLGLMTLLLISFKTAKTKKIIELKIKELAYINELSMTIGLFTLSVGTFLGGVWANESWGRYWAWDPKETWALISIIVYAIVLHLRFIPKLNNTYTISVASMFAFWSIIMTSFGVNYYLSGLHSYAAGDSVPIPVFVYLIFAIMIGTSIVAFFKEKRKKN
ncbi:cytochrome c biogenesis protein CcsA [Tenacibaculum maritimum]|uniref:cytochrome c biogenesis protein CcsA n=1 Tax=Tenacibaculum maritimum TaxID=107401 RepID=UPI0012E61C18|nr:cytochrome c biogenesis protein CcsA [Tenacibaculum maritimum]CAA0186906.1 Cytochrome c assembly protein [Tenacibaculum maritimum]